MVTVQVVGEVPESWRLIRTATPIVPPVLIVASCVSVPETIRERPG